MNRLNRATRLFMLNRTLKATKDRGGSPYKPPSAAHFCLYRLFACGELCEPLIHPFGFVDPNPRRGCKRNPRTHPESMQSPSATHNAIALALLLLVHGITPFPC